MTASVLLRPRWVDPVMFLYDGGSDDVTGGMDAFSGSDLAANQCRNLMAYQASLPPGVAYASSEHPAPGPGDPVTLCGTCSAARGPAGASLPYGYFSSGHYPCRMPHQCGVKTGAQPAPAPAYAGEKCAGTSVPGEQFASRPKEFAFYPSYTAGPYQPVPSYLDLSGTGGHAEPRNETRHETLLPVDSYQPWPLSDGWGGQLYCGKEQTPPRALWKPRLPDTASQAAADGCSYRRGRKKRVPYTKAQLRELEREYAANRFITKDTRRRISAQTGLTERQVTIWFQNRRVKEKKVVSKPKINS